MTRHGQRRTAAPIVTALLLAAVLTSFGPVAASARAAAPVETKYSLAPGVTLTTISYPAVPHQVRVLTVTQGHGLVPDVFAAGSHYPAYRRPSQMGADALAVGTVNGDFAMGGRSAHLSLIDGELWSSGIQEGAAFALTVDGGRAWVGAPHLTVNAVDVGRGTEFRIARYNAGDPTGDVVAGYSARGGSAEHPPGDPAPGKSSPYFCAARLVPDGSIAWAGSNGGRLARSYVVDAQPDPCVQTPLPIGSIDGSVVIATRRAGSGAASVVALDRGDRVRLTWGVQELDGAVDVLGGRPMLVADGVNVAPPYDGVDYFTNFNPRTGVGVTQGCTDLDVTTKCKIFIVTVDGRAPKWSKGMRLPRFAQVFIDLGATWAMNLDGGGGTVMWVKKRDAAYCEELADAGGCLVGRPSDAAGERAAVLGLGVVLAPDVGEPSALR